MSDVISMNDMLGVASGDKNNMLGKLLYFSLSDLLIDKEKLTELCAGMGIYYAGDRRVSVSDAFKSATGDIKDHIVVKHFGQQQIYRVYCRDNEHTARVLSRELVKETLNRETNQYEKLANISFDKESGLFSYDNLAYDSDVDAAAYCRRAEELFELYQTCANRKQIETILPQLCPQPGGYENERQRTSLFRPPAQYGEGGYLRGLHRGSEQPQQDKIPPHGKLHLYNR